MNISTIWEYNGVSIPLDRLDVETAKRVENAILMAQDELKQAPKEGRYTDVLASHCDILRRLFTRAFGEDVVKALFGERNHFGELTDAYTALIEFINLQNEQIAGSQRDTLERFSADRAKR